MSCKIQAVCSRLLFAQDRVRAQFSPSEVCGVKSDIGTCFCLSTWVFLYQCRSTAVPYSYVQRMGPVEVKFHEDIISLHRKEKMLQSHLLQSINSPILTGIETDISVYTSWQSAYLLYLIKILEF